MVMQGRPFFGADIQKLGAIAAAGEWADAGDGSASSETYDIMDEYIERLLQGLAGLRAPYRLGCGQRCGGTGD